MRWRKGHDASSPTGRSTSGYLIEIDGRPTIRTKLDILPPPDFQATTFDDFMVLGMILTAMPAINAIPAVVAAPPGIVTYTDVPLPLPRGLVPDRAADRCGYEGHPRSGAMTSSPNSASVSGGAKSQNQV